MIELIKNWFADAKESLDEFIFACRYGWQFPDFDDSKDD